MKKITNNRFCSSALSRLFPPQIMTAQNSFKVMSRQKTGSYLFIFKKWYLMGSDRCTYISKHVCLEKKSALKCNYSSTIIFPLPHDTLHVGELYSQLHTGQEKTKTSQQSPKLLSYLLVLIIINIQQHFMEHIHSTCRVLPTYTCNIFLQHTGKNYIHKCIYVFLLNHTCNSCSVLCYLPHNCPPHIEENIHSVCTVARLGRHRWFLCVCGKAALLCVRSLC